jgi:aspartyl-tRNA(Asn)/glutamyl-tRNA(Gln) amidotransferase subunit C
MSIDKQTIDRLGTLARIELTPVEKKRLTIQLDRIVGYVKQLQQLDTGKSKSSRPAAESAALRRDNTAPCIDRDSVLDQAPDTTNHFFRVPRIIEK